MLNKKVSCALDVLSALCAGQPVTLPDGPDAIDIAAELNDIIKKAAACVEEVKEGCKTLMEKENQTTRFGLHYKATLTPRVSAPLIATRVFKELGQKKFLEVCSVTKKAVEKYMGLEQIDKCSGEAVTTYSIGFKKR